MQSSPSPLEYFVDRSLGRQDVPDALTARGLEVRTMSSAYPVDGQFITDEQWLRDCMHHGWVVLSKDKGLRRIIGYLPELHQETLRVFILMNGNLASAQQVEHFENNLERIVEAALEPGPFICGVYANQIRQLWP